MEREVGGGIGMGNTCKPMGVSFQCMTKFTTNKKKKEKLYTCVCVCSSKYLYSYFSFLYLYISRHENISQLGLLILFQSEMWAIHAIFAIMTILNNRHNK